MVESEDTDMNIVASIQFADLDRITELLKAGFNEFEVYFSGLHVPSIPNVQVLKADAEEKKYAVSTFAKIKIRL